jgi:hypothetical protein
MLMPCKELSCHAEMSKQSSIFLLFKVEGTIAQVQPMIAVATGFCDTTASTKQEIPPKSPLQRLCDTLMYDVVRPIA